MMGKMRFRDVGIKTVLRPDVYEFWPVFSDPELASRMSRMPGHIATLCLAKNIIRMRELAPGGEEWARRHFSLPHAAQRLRLVECIARVGVSSRTCGALQVVPRHLFIREPFDRLAYVNHTLPFSAGLSWATAPLVVAVMLDATLFYGRAKAVELGAGCGYHMACLAATGVNVVGYEANIAYADFGNRCLKHAGLGHLGVRAGLLAGKELRSESAGAVVYCTFSCGADTVLGLLRDMEPGTPLICPRTVTYAEFEAGSFSYPKIKFDTYEGYLEKPDDYLCIAALTMDAAGVVSDRPILYDVRFVPAVMEAFVEEGDPSPDHLAYLQQILP